MSYINTARKSRLTLNGVDESSRMISWQVNDDSVFKNGIMKTSGNIVLGTTSLTQYDYQRQAYKRGQLVEMSLWDSESAEWVVHPRGLLFVLSTSFDPSEQKITIEIGCQLSIWVLSDNVQAIYDHSPVELFGGQRTIQNVSQALYTSNKFIYQDNTGGIVEMSTLDLSSAPDAVETVPGLWATGSKSEALSSVSLSGDSIPEIIDIEYNYNPDSIFSDPEKVTADTSSYDINFNAATWVRTGSGEELGSVETIDDSYDGTPGAAIGQYEKVVDVVKVSSSRTETTTQYFNGASGQLSQSVQEAYVPGIEINASYFEDQYSYCRYQAAVNGDADSASCSYLQATSPILASRIVTNLTYDDAGTVVSRTVEQWEPVLAAAQPFNWKEADGDYGQPTTFDPISLTDIFRASIVTTDYSQDEDGNNIETITSYKSAAVEYNAGIYEVAETIGSGEVGISQPSSYPPVAGVTSLDLPTDSVTGSGSGMTVSIAWPAEAGVVSEVQVTSSLSDCQYAVKAAPGCLYGSRDGSYTSGPVWTDSRTSGWIHNGSVLCNGVSGFRADVYATTADGQFVRLYPELNSFFSSGFEEGTTLVFTAVGGSGTYTTTVNAGTVNSQYAPTAATVDENSTIGTRAGSAVLYWRNLPRLNNLSDENWIGGSGSGFNGYLQESALPDLTSNVVSTGTAYSNAASWATSINGTSFIGDVNSMLVVDNGGSGYSIGDTLTWTRTLTSADLFGSQSASHPIISAGSHGQQLSTTTVTAQVTLLSVQVPALTVETPGDGYASGDQIRVTASVLSASLGETVTQDLLFTVISGDSGVPNLGQGIASLSQTNWNPSPSATNLDDYARSGGTVYLDYRYNQSENLPTSIVNESGSNGIVASFSAYDPDTKGKTGPVQISPLSVRGDKGLQIIDNGYIRSAAIPGSAFSNTRYDFYDGQVRSDWCWESWVYVDEIGPAGAALMHLASASGYPTTYSNWVVPQTSNRGDYAGELPGLYLLGNSIVASVVAYESDTGDETFILNSFSTFTASYPTREWFHVAFVQDAVHQTDNTSDEEMGFYKLYVNGALEGSMPGRVTWESAGIDSSPNSSEPSNIYIYTGAGGYSNSDSDISPAGNNPNAVEGMRAGTSQAPSSNDDFVKIALDNTRFSSSTAQTGTGGVYYTAFAPIDSDAVTDTGTTLEDGIHEGIRLVPSGGTGKAATGNLEVISGSGANAGGTGWDVCLVAPALAYTETIGVTAPTGGNGSGMKVSLGVGYSGQSYSGKSPIVVRSVPDGGNGYKNGDILEIPASEVERLLSDYGGGTVDNGLRFSVTPPSSFEAGAWIFPDVVGTQFEVGDVVSMTRSSILAAGAGDAEQDITATVTAITPSRPLRTLTLDAIDGGKRIVTNTSKTDSVLPNNPDTSATPALPTLTSNYKLAARLNSYSEGQSFLPDTDDESLQVPGEYLTTESISDFVEDYSNYLRTFAVGEGYGLRLGESMRTEVMDSWVPMAGLRYTDERIDETFAMRADAASWGVSAEEAAVVYNGIWLGTVHYTAGSGTTIGGGDFTLDVTFADDGDQYDGGNFTQNSASSTGSDVISGGDFISGDGNGSESYLDVGEILQYSLKLSFDSSRTFTLLSGTTSYPFSIDWEGTALAEEFTSGTPSHNYAEGDYTLAVYFKSGANSNVDLVMNNSQDAPYVTEAHFASGARLVPSLSSAFRGCTNLTSLTVSSSADFSGVTNIASFVRETGLTSFPYFLTSSTISAASAWRDTSSLTDFPANFFDHIEFTTGTSPFNNAWLNSALSPESIGNILTSLDTMTLLPTDSPITNTNITISGGTNASYSTWGTAAQAALASLQAKGWNVAYNA
jgi:hypothetical protein